MKNFFGLLMVVGLLGLVSCKGDKATTGEASESLATTATTTPAADPAAAVSTEPAADAAPVGPTTTIEFAETTFDFGTVNDGEKVVHVYKFTNTGDNPLIISNAKGSCGCTVPDWPKDPIAPGKTGDIRVEFDSKGKGSPEGAQQAKRVTITANTDPVNTYLNIKGVVKKTGDAQ